MARYRYFLSIFAILSSCVLTLSARSATERFGSTDLFPKTLQLELQKWSSNYSKQCFFGASRAISEKVQSGQYVFGVIASQEDLKLPQDLEGLAIGYMPVEFFVSKDCPIEDISFAQLRQVLAANALLHWGDLGLTGSWTRSEIKCVVWDFSEKRFVANFLESKILKGASLSPAVEPVLKRSRLLELGDTAKLLVASIGNPDPDQFKPLAVDPAFSLGAPLVGYTASTLNCFTGDYPLFVAIYICYRDFSETEAFLRFWFSGDFEISLAQAGLLPLPKKEQEMHLKRFDTFGAF